MDNHVNMVFLRTCRQERGPAKPDSFESSTFNMLYDLLAKYACKPPAIQFGIYLTHIPTSWQNIIATLSLNTNSISCSALAPESKTMIYTVPNVVRLNHWLKSNLPKKYLPKAPSLRNRCDCNGSSGPDQKYDLPHRHRLLRLENSCCC